MLQYVAVSKKAWFRSFVLTVLSQWLVLQVLKFISSLLNSYANQCLAFSPHGYFAPWLLLSLADLPHHLG